MRRREFLLVAGAGLAGNAAVRSIAAAEPANAVTVRQAASDCFTLDFAPAQPRPLRVLQITDTHFGTPNDEHKRKDERTFVTIRKLVESEKPDFIVHTGDFVNNDKGRGVRFDAIDFFNGLDVPWTLCLGNHDIGARSVADIRQQMKNHAFGEFKVDGTAHNAFRLDVVTAGRSEPAWSLFCFDSGFQKGAKHVSREQVAWFNRQMRGDADAGLKSPALAMIHIPVFEFETARAAKKTTGHFGERVSFESDKGDTFTALANSGRVQGIFSGHDHHNDFHGKWHDIELAYGRVGGWGGYGDLPRGGRLIEIDPAAGSYAHRLVAPEV